MLLGWLIGFMKKLGWFYTVALSIAAFSLVMFAKLTEEIFEQSRLLILNHTVLHWLHLHAHHHFDRVAVALSQLGGVYGISTVFTILLVWFYTRKRYLDGTVMILVVLGGLVLTYVLKNTFRIPRPELFISIMPEGGFSFPSGHSLMSVCLFGYLAALTVLTRPYSLRRWLYAGGICLIPLAIMWSRLYLGVHWLSDVLAGGAVASFWVMLCLVLRRKYYSRKV